MEFKSLKDFDIVEIKETTSIVGGSNGSDSTSSESCGKETLKLVGNTGGSGAGTVFGDWTDDGCC